MICSICRQKIMAQGRARARAAGKRFGRKPKLGAAQREQAEAMRAQGATMMQIGEHCHVSHSTISRLLKGQHNRAEEEDRWNETQRG